MLPVDVERRIDKAIDTIFKTRERPTLEKLRRDLRTDCKTAGLKPPSRKAIQARVSARSQPVGLSQKSGRITIGATA